MARAKGRVYSYIRFSTPEQKLGDSERRQLELAKNYADQNNLELDESLRDEGLSGYHGTHRTKGALGKFLARVEGGDVPVDSKLVIENLDRLTRQPVMEAIKIIQLIVENGITIVCIEPYQREYTLKRLNEGGIYELIGQLERAHGESRMKSTRLKEVRRSQRERARTTGKPYSRNCPGWLRVSDDGERYEVISEAETAVQLVFDLRLEGVGFRRIALRLQQEGGWMPPRGKGWRDTYVQKLLSFRAVVGEFEPHTMVDGKRRPEEPIKDFYPRIIEDDVFYAVQAMKRTDGAGGRKDRCGNLVRHLVFCGYCGGKMAYENKGYGPKGRPYLYCDNGFRGIECDRYRIPYLEVEELILKNCPKLDPGEVLNDAKERKREVAQLTQREAALREQIREKETECDTLDSRMGKVDDRIFDRIKKQLTKLEDEIAELKGELTVTERARRNADTTRKKFVRWQEAFKDLVNELANGTDVELRHRLRVHLPTLIERIDVFAHGFEKRYDPAVDGSDERRKGKDGRFRRVKRINPNADLFYERAVAGVDEAFEPSDPERAFMTAFMDHLADERLTRKGRFIRVKFKTGRSIQMAPPKSLGDGLELVFDERGRPSWEKSDGPSLLRRMQNFRTEYNKRQAAEAEVRSKASKSTKRKRSQKRGK